jgi:hypothetical protein
MRQQFRGAIFKMPSIKIKTNAVAAINNSMAYMQGVAEAPREAVINHEIGMAFASIAKRSLSSFIDQEARLSPASMHHVYEWGQLGKPTGRLWKIESTYKPGVIAINSDFRQSRTYVPLTPGTKRRHKFTFKAEVMEKGKPVTIRAKNASALFFYSKNGDPVFIPKSKSVVIKSPGGKFVKGAYAKTMRRFQTSARFLVDIEQSRILKRLELAQKAAGIDMPTSVSTGSTPSTFIKMAKGNSAKHINQVTRMYKADGELNG